MDSKQKEQITMSAFNSFLADTSAVGQVPAIARSLGASVRLVKSHEMDADEGGFIIDGKRLDKYEIDVSCDRAPVSVGIYWNRDHEMTQLILILEADNLAAMRLVEELEAALRKAGVILMSAVEFLRGSP